DPGGSGASSCSVSGTLCPSGSVQCDQACCSRSCGPTGGENGKNVCQNPSGCHPVGELCRADSDCCGISCSKTNPSDQFGRCANQATACKEAGQICKVGGSASCSSSNNCCEPPGMASGTCNNSPEKCCHLDALNIPRCLMVNVGDCTVIPPAGT